MKMTKWQFRPIIRDANLTPPQFQTRYVNAEQPVILTDFSANWSARQKWTLNYFKSHVGQIEVPLYDEAFADSGKDYLAPTTKMRFGKYLDIIAAGPTKLRMFLFNVFKCMPTLCED